jgi:hypothetical protein
MLVEPVAAVDVNVPGAIAMLLAPLVTQLSVPLAPEVRLAGAAVKEIIFGAAPGGVDDFTELHPARAKQPSRKSIMAQRSRAVAFNTRDLSLLLQSEPTEAMHSPLVVVNNFIVTINRLTQRMFREARLFRASL